MTLPVTFTVIIPYHLSPSSDRRAMMDRLTLSLPDRADMEVLWVNDRSTLPWSPPQGTRTRHHLHTSPEGACFAGPARNHGMAQAAGRWLLFCDSDDLVDAQALNRACDAILADEGRAASTDLYAFPSRAVDHQGQPVQSVYVNTVWNRARTANSPLPLVYHFPPWSKIVRRAFVDAHQLEFGPQKAGEDAVFSAILALKHPTTSFIDDPWYIYTIPDLSRKMPADAVQGAFQAHRFVQKNVKNIEPSLRVGAVGLFIRNLKHSPLTTIKEGYETILSGLFFPPINTAQKRIRQYLNTKNLK